LSASASKGKGGEESMHPTSTGYNYSAIAKCWEATTPCRSLLVGPSKIQNSNPLEGQETICLLLLLNISWTFAII